MSYKNASKPMSCQGVKNDKKLDFSSISRCVSRIHRYMKMKSTYSMFFIDNRYEEKHESEYSREIVLFQINKIVN
ncbi:MAG: hypothetical protein PUE01_02885 [Clostridiaceae bacterium]|nr:hypothetical protein [Clostridiaceae bacterium]